MGRGKDIAEILARGTLMLGTLGLSLAVASMYSDKNLIPFLDLVGEREERKYVQPDDISVRLGDMNRDGEYNEAILSIDNKDYCIKRDGGDLYLSPARE